LVIHHRQEDGVIPTEDEVSLSVWQDNMEYAYSVLHTSSAVLSLTCAHNGA
jgi:hypothetical protein